MKLSTKTSLNFLSVALFTFLFGIIAFYFTLRFQVDRYINTELLKAKESFLNKSDSLQNFNAFFYGTCQLASHKPLLEAKSNVSTFKDTLIFDRVEKKYLPYRQMNFTTQMNHQAYEFTMLRSLSETDTLIINLFLIMTLLVMVLILALLFINTFSSFQIWKDFYSTLDRINHFGLNIQEKIELPNTDIKEFEDLNKVLMRMSTRIASDYFRMKEYTENASHEIQTPLAIITAKLELLLQCKDLPEKQYQIIADAYDATNRLARLNKTLILLTRIENRQFPEIEWIEPKEIIERQLENYEEIIASKGLQVRFDFEENVKIQINPYLSDVLFLNLIKNAIRHNIPNGILLLKLTSTQFTISNSGEPLNVEAEMLFNRFFKSSKSSKSIGLGLPIVKKITELFDIEITYTYQNDLHKIELLFPKKP